MKKGIEFTIEFEGVKENEIMINEKFIEPLLKALDETTIPLTNIGFYVDSGNFVIQGEIVKLTKKECEAEYTLFKERMKRVLKNYGLKKAIDRMKLYFDTLY